MTSDQIIKCTACDTPFVWTRGEPGDLRPEYCPVCRKLAPASGRLRGIVKWYSRGKSYGFITPAQGADVFLHKSGLRGEQVPCAGQLVEYAVTSSPRGVQACDVEILRIDSEVAC